MARPQIGYYPLKKTFGVATPGIISFDCPITGKITQVYILSVIEADGDAVFDLNINNASVLDDPITLENGQNSVSVTLNISVTEHQNVSLDLDSTENPIGNGLLVWVKVEETNANLSDTQIFNKILTDFKYREFTYVIVSGEVVILTADGDAIFDLRSLTDGSS